MSATFYHAGLNDAEKDLRQHQWQEDKIRIMVATNAFGMGIDKPDVRLVIHLDLPDSIEAYFQEAGRAGRDGAQAYAVLLYQRHDRTRLMKRIPDTFPDKDAIREVYEHICYYYQMAMGDGYNVTREFDLDEFCRNFKHFPVQTDSALHLLERAGYIEYTEEQDNASRIHFLLRRDELYRIHELEAEQEQLIQWVLRSYGGVFSDYVFIDERRIATLSGLTTDQVYHGLLALGRARILHYIPAKKRLISPFPVNASKKNVSYSLLPCTTNARKILKSGLRLCCTMPKRLTSAVAKSFCTISAKKTHNPANNVTFAGYGNLIHMRMLRTNKSSRLYWRL